MKIVFSSRARSDLIESAGYIASDKPQAARRWAATVRESISKLKKHPRMGRIVPEYGDRSIWEIISGNYRIVYKIDQENDTIVVVTIHHGRKRLT